MQLNPEKWGAFMCEKDIYTATFLKGDSKKREALQEVEILYSFEVGLTN